MTSLQCPGEQKANAYAQKAHAKPEILVQLLGGAHTVKVFKFMLGEPANSKDTARNR